MISMAPSSTTFLLLFLMAIVSAVVVDNQSQNSPDDDHFLEAQAGLSSHKHRHKRRTRSDRPNIVLIITDDQDAVLGSIKAMPKLQNLLIREGTTFNNSFVSTPMCCPSRSTMLTGLYVHNHNVHTNNENCSSPQWIREHEPHTFATYLQNAGYRTGYFGKYLNKYNGSYAPLGWDQWVGLVRNSRFYNYSLSYNGQLEKHGDNYYSDYLTDLIANDSVAFFKRSKRTHFSKPVMMVLSVPAPHGPEDAAPQYQHMFVNNTDHRTPSWNVAPNLDKQWLLRQMKPMTPQFKMFTDLLQRRRLQTLQSVDDLIEKVYQELAMLGELDNTYIIFTSDHGYHLGQFGLIKGKSMAFDFDVRVPLIVRGPGIKAGSVISNMALNVDLAPTLIEMGKVDIPPHMDGVSLLRLMKATRDHTSIDSKGFVNLGRPWRDTILLERGKVSMKILKEQWRKEKAQLLMQGGNQPNLHLYLGPKQQKVARICSNQENLPPCKPNQKWFCEVDETGNQHLFKCRGNGNHEDVNHDDRISTDNTFVMQGDEAQPCICSDGREGRRITSQNYQRRHRRFLKHKARRKAKVWMLRHRRSVVRDQVDFDQTSSNLPISHSTGFDLYTPRCRILANSTVLCDQDIYRNFDEWQAHRERIEEMIKEYKKALDDLRDIRDHLLEQRPSVYPAAENESMDQRGQEENVADDICDCDMDSLGQRNPDEDEDSYQQYLLRRDEKRLRKMEERRHKRNQRARRKKKNCNGSRMKCFSHDDEHWKTPPYWTFWDEDGGSQSEGCPSLRRHRRLNFPPCFMEGMECVLMDNCHWKTPPFWTHGPFCFCSNSNNNTYWCLRTINETHDIQYCEYITNFISFYDLRSDPFQLHNVAKTLNYGILQQLHDQLAKMKNCKSSRHCDLHNFHGSHITIDNIYDYDEDDEFWVDSHFDDDTPVDSYDEEEETDEELDNGESEDLFDQNVDQNVDGEFDGDSESEYDSDFF